MSNFETNDFSIELPKAGDKLVDATLQSKLVVGQFALNEPVGQPAYWAFRPTLNYQFDAESLEQLWTICDHLNG